MNPLSGPVLCSISGPIRLTPHFPLSSQRTITTRDMVCGYGACGIGCSANMLRPEAMRLIAPDGTA